MKRKQNAGIQKNYNCNGMDAAAPSAATHVDLDAERRGRIARNKAQLDALGLRDVVSGLVKELPGPSARANKVSRAVRKPRVRVQPQQLRRSHRLAGAAAPDMVELDDDGKPLRVSTAQDADEEGGTGLLDLLGRGAVRVKMAVGALELDDEQRAALDIQRCSSKSRGSVYDKNLGLTCHFCRQKKLCGEDDCPHCSARNAQAVCIGKTSCACCSSATGIFCRACLKVRYGQDLDKVRSDPSWLCPHCYLDKHGPWEQHGWFCNSSICMRHVGMVPTGIAIHQALAKGYISVAHMLQAAALEKRKQEGEHKRTERGPDVNNPQPAAIATAAVETDGEL